MSALQLNNAVPIKSPSTIKTTLPSFDDLLKSLEESSTSVNLNHDLQHHHVHSHHHSGHVGHPPYPSPHHHHHGHGYVYRPPSTPPTPKSLSSSSSTGAESSEDGYTSQFQHHTRRPRSNSLPSSSRTHLKSPFREMHLLPTSIEHHTNRIKCLKEGDGEWAPYSLNAVAPSSLPYSALACETSFPPSIFNGLNSPLWEIPSSSTAGSRKKIEILLTPPSSPPLLPIPLPIPEPEPETGTYQTDPDSSYTNTSKNNERISFTTKYKRTFDSSIDIGPLQQHDRKRQCQYQHRYHLQNIHPNSSPECRSKPNERLWHFIGEKGCHLQSYHHHDHKHHIRREEEEETKDRQESVVVEAILMHMLRLGDKRACSMM